VIFKEAIDGHVEVSDWSEDAALETPLGQDGEKALDGVEPRRRGRGEVERPARVLREPSPHRGMPAKPMLLDWNKVIFKQLTIVKGVYGREMFETWHKMIAMLESGLDVRKVITHRLPAKKFLEGFEIMRRGESGKIVLDWIRWVSFEQDTEAELDSSGRRLESFVKSEAAPVPNPVSEADLVESAFEDEVKLLYKNLCVGLNDVGGVPRPADEQQCLQRFKTGLTLARRARELALSAVTPAASAHMAAKQGIAQRTIVAEFDSVEQAIAAHDSPAYQAALAVLGNTCERDVRIAEGVDGSWTHLAAGRIAWCLTLSAPLEEVMCAP
jgi:Domain of unknown function (DUF1330)